MKVCETQFSRAHDELLVYFVIAIENLGLEWLKTDSGIAWITYLEKQKYSIANIKEESQELQRLDQPTITIFH
jgi:hypothetical protein